MAALSPGILEGRKRPRYSRRVLPKQLRPSMQRLRILLHVVKPGRALPRMREGFGSIAMAHDRRRRFAAIVSQLGAKMSRDTSPALSYKKTAKPVGGANSCRIRGVVHISWPGPGKQGPDGTAGESPSVITKRRAQFGFYFRKE